MKKLIPVGKRDTTDVLPPIPDAFRLKMERLIDQLPEERKETMNVPKRKLSLTLILALVLLALAATALAFTLLSAQEVVERTAVPAAQENDKGAILRNEQYSPEELSGILAAAAENGITLDESSGLIQALRHGDGYWEEETIMQICRDAFGGLYNDWTLAERHWFGDMMVQIGYTDVNTVEWPGADEMQEEEATAFALSQAEGAVPDFAKDNYRLRDEYATAEDGAPGLWHFTLTRRAMSGGDIELLFRGDRTDVSVTIQPVPAANTLRLSDLLNQIDMRLGGNRGEWNRWPDAAWRAVDALKAQTVPGEKETLLESGVRACSYPAPAAGDATKEQAEDAALAAHPGTCEGAVLMEAQGKRVWKVLVRQGDERVACEVDSASGQAGDTRTIGRADLPEWAAYLPFSLYDELTRDIVPLDRARETAVQALCAAAGREIPLLDADAFDLDAFYNEYAGQWRLTFRAKTLDFGRCEAAINADGTVASAQADADALTGNNLLARYANLYGSFDQWDQTQWAAVRRAADALDGDSLAFLTFKRTEYPAADAAAVSRKDAMTVAARAAGDTATEVWSAILIASAPNPVWKVRVLCAPSSLLYEIDAKTGAILSQETYHADYDAFDPPCKLFTLRSVFAAVQLEKEGPEPAARNAVAKAYGDPTLDCPDEPLTNPDLYDTLVDGLTVTYRTKDASLPGFVVTVGADGLVQSIAVTPAADGGTALTPGNG